MAGVIYRTSRGLYELNGETGNAQFPGDLRILGNLTVDGDEAGGEIASIAALRAVTSATTYTDGDILWVAAYYVDGLTGGGAHMVMFRGKKRIAVPNPHGGDIDWTLTKRILKQAGIDPKDWDALG